jgi:hypothetical protein
VGRPIDAPTLIAELASDLVRVLAIPSRTATYGFSTAIADDLHGDAHVRAPLTTLSVNRSVISECLPKI